MNYVKNNKFNHTHTKSINIKKIFLIIPMLFLIISINISAQQYIDYQIREGDCLWTIAREYQLSIQEVAKVNDIKEEEILSPGQLIKIPLTQTSQQDQNSKIIIHTVKKGESLWDIAQQYRLSLDCISSVNDLKQPDSLYIGQEINIPMEDDNIEIVKELSFVKADSEENNSKYQGMSSSLNQEFQESLKEANYTVKAGESLWTIAQDYKVSINEISRVNGIENEDKLSIGQIIKIPLSGKGKDEDNSFASEQTEINTDEFQYEWVEHIVETGESISLIAQKYHVSIATICQLNDITEKDYVYPGQRIKIKATPSGDNKNKIIDDYQPIYYTVKAGDTLWTIAQEYSVTLEGILAVNYLNDKDVLSVGQKLEIPAIGGVNSKKMIQTVEYSVVKGDSLWNIAEKFNVKMTDIINANQLQNVTQLSVGQKLNIPSTPSAIAAVQARTTTTTSASEVTEKTGEKPQDLTHYVQKGETLWGISRKYQVNIQNITSANNITETSRLTVGQKLIIPNVRYSSISPRSFVWPVNGLITSQFGMRTLGGRRDYHTGIDIDGNTSTSIRAAESGKVSFSGYINGYGNIIIIDHAGGYSTVYAHNSSNLVKEGQNINKGDLIGKVGATGNATGSHLHFEIRENGKPINPLSYLP